MAKKVSTVDSINSRASDYTNTIARHIDLIKRINNTSTAFTSTYSADRFIDTLQSALLEPVYITFSVTEEEGIILKSPSSWMYPLSQWDNVNLTTGELTRVPIDGHYRYRYFHLGIGYALVERPALKKVVPLLYINSGPDYRAVFKKQEKNKK